MTEPGVSNGDSTIPVAMAAPAPAVPIAADPAVPESAERLAPSGEAESPAEITPVVAVSPSVDAEPAPASVEAARIPEALVEPVLAAPVAVVEPPPPVPIAAAAPAIDHAAAVPVAVPPPVAAPAPVVAAVAPTPPVAAVALASGANGPPPGEALDDRLRRLEAALAKLGEPRPQEQHSPAKAEAVPVTPTPVVVESPRRWLPAALETVIPRSSGELPGARPPWLLWDILIELRSIKHMYGDPRYRLTWPGRLIPPALLVLIFTTWIWLAPMIAVLPNWMSTMLIKVVDLCLAFFLFKVLSREAQRYREIIPQYPPVPYA
jgi:hypothetical protein